MLRFFASLRPSSLSGPRVLPPTAFLALGSALAPFVAFVAAFLVPFFAGVLPDAFLVVAMLPPWECWFVDCGSLAGYFGIGNKRVPAKRTRLCSLQIPGMVVADDLLLHLMTNRSSAGIKPIR